MMQLTIRINNVLNEIVINSSISLRKMFLCKTQFNRHSPHKPGLADCLHTIKGFDVKFYGPDTLLVPSR